MKIKKNVQGFVLPILLVSLMIASFLIVSVTSQTIANHQSASREQYRVNAQLAADSGLDRSFIELTNDSDWTGTVGEIELYDNGSIRTTYEIDISDGSSDERKIIRSIGRTYSPSTATTAKTTRIFEVEAEAVTSGTGAASVVSGVGGLLLNNNAKITGGDVVVNGVVQINNNAQIGLSSNPVNVRVAHQVCPNPADATYPRVCNSGENGQPITVDTNGVIYANVQATNQTNGTRMFSPGLITGSSFAPLPMPDFDRDAITSTVSTTVSGNVTTCPGGARTYGTNTSSVTKIVGNLDPPNNCKITIYGSLWITGRISTGNNVEFIVPAAQTTTKPNVMVDGSSGITLGNNFKVTTNSSGTGIYFVTFYSRASCSPNCTTVSGADLANSINDRTIDLSNNASANGSILYARWSKVRVQNNGNLGAISGMTVELSNNAIINFTTSVPGSDNLVTTWVKRGYLRVFQ